MNFIAATRPGEIVAIEVVRDGKRINISATVGSRPERRAATQGGGAYLNPQ
jgi:S1-C subfamily serine protease